MMLLSSPGFFFFFIIRLSIQLNQEIQSFWRILQRREEACFVDVVVRIKWSTVAGHAQWNAHVGPI